MSKNGTVTTVSKQPTCDVHRVEQQVEVPALYDAKLSIGPWAFVCQECFDIYGCALGTGQGQKLEVVA